jgi:DNA-binding NarL/FixJ family response regulator
MNQPDKPLLVAVVEDDAGLRRTLEAMLQRMDGMACAGCYATAEEALEEIPKRAAAVVLMDIRLPGMDGVECVRRLKEALPKTQIVMLTVHDHTHAVFESLAAGASGFLLKPVRAADLSRSIREVAAGGAPMTPNIARLVVQTFQKPVTTSDPGAEGMATLSPRESEVLDLLAKGFLQKEIADQLGISFWTVQTHTSRIYEKLQVRSRAQAVAKYFGK